MNYTIGDFAIGFMKKLTGLAIEVVMLILMLQVLSCALQHKIEIRLEVGQEAKK